MNKDELYTGAMLALEADMERNVIREELARKALNYMNERVLPAVGRELWGRPDVEFSLSYSLNTWYSTPWGDATLHITMKNGDSWNEATPVLEELQNAGFKIDEWQSTDDAKNFARTFGQTLYLEKLSSGECSVRVMLTLMLREGNTAGCRRVFVGKKFETNHYERDEYKLVCDSEAATETSS